MKKIIAAGLVGAATALAASKLGAAGTPRYLLIDSARECPASTTVKASACPPASPFMLIVASDGTLSIGTP